MTSSGGDHRVVVIVALPNNDIGGLTGGSRLEREGEVR